MGTGCVGCGVIVFISHRSEFGVVACVWRQTLCAVSPAASYLTSDRAGRRAKMNPENVPLRVTSGIQHPEAMAG